MWVEQRIKRTGSNSKTLIMLRLSIALSLNLSKPLISFVKWKLIITLFTRVVGLRKVTSKKAFTNCKAL